METFQVLSVNELKHNEIYRIEGNNYWKRSKNGFYAKKITGEAYGNHMP